MIRNIVHPNSFSKMRNPTFFLGRCFITRKAGERKRKRIHLEREISRLTVKRDRRSRARASFKALVQPFFFWNSENSFFQSSIFRFHRQFFFVTNTCGSNSNCKHRRSFSMALIEIPSPNPARNHSINRRSLTGKRVIRVRRLYFRHSFPAPLFLLAAIFFSRGADEIIVPGNENVDFALHGRVIVGQIERLFASLRRCPRETLIRRGLRWTDTSPAH